MPVIRLKTIRAVFPFDTILHNGGVSWDMIEHELDSIIQKELLKAGVPPDLYHAPTAMNEEYVNRAGLDVHKAIAPRFRSVRVEDLHFSIGDPFGSMHHIDNILFGMASLMTQEDHHPLFLLLQDRDYPRFLKESRYAEADLQTGGVKALGMTVLKGYPMNRIIGIARGREWTESEVGRH